MTSITIPNSVTSIGISAFQDTDALTTIIIDQDDSTLNSIGDYAFNHATSLISITIPDSVTEIGDGAFQDTDELTTIIIDQEDSTLNSIGDYAFNRATSLISITIPNSVTEIGDGAFQDTDALTTIIIDQEDSTLNSIGDYAFNRATSLISITIPNSVTEIGDGAFQYAANLSLITIHDSATIGVNAFDDISQEPLIYLIPQYVTFEDFKLTFNGSTNISNITYIDLMIPTTRIISTNNDVFEINITGELTMSSYGSYIRVGNIAKLIIGRNVTSIGTDAFSRSTNLTSVSIPDSVTYIGYSSFYLCGLTSLTIPDSVTTIQGGAFTGAPLTSVTFGRNSKLTLLGETVFKSTKITTITVPNGVRTLQRDIFRDTPLSSIGLPISLTSIGATAFQDCKQLESIIFPDSLTRIGVHAFRNAYALTYITIPDSVTLDYLAFRRISPVSVVYVLDVSPMRIFDDFTTYFDGTHTRGDSLKYVDVGNININDSIFTDHSGNAYHVGIIGELTESSYETHISKSNIAQVVVGSNVTSIGDNAFNEATALKYIAIPNSVTSIGDSAFRGATLLRTVNISQAYSTLNSIGNYAFYNATALISIDIPNSVTSIGDSAFSGAGVRVVNISQTNYSLNIIGASAFDSTNLSSLYIPVSVTEIGDNAFRDCTRLTSITTPDSVTIGDHAFDDISALPTVYVMDVSRTITFVEFQSIFNDSTNISNITYYDTTH